MKFTFELTKSDFLAYQLFNSSKSELHRRKRRRAQLSVPILYLILGVYSVINNSVTLAIVFLIVGVLWFFFYPKFANQRYKNYLKKYVEENHANKPNKEVELRFEEDALHAKDSAVNSVIKGSEITEISETTSHYFLKLKGGSSLIIPHSAVEYAEKFKAIITSYGAVYKDETNWVWK